MGKNPVKYREIYTIIMDIFHRTIGQYQVAFFARSLLRPIGSRLTLRVATRNYMQVEDL